MFCLFFWLVTASLIFYQTISGISKGVNHVQRLHQIPCSKCAYFTGDYRLKCPVNPIIALSEEAINCRDFQLDSEFKNHKNIHCSKSLTN